MDVEKLSPHEAWQRTVSLKADTHAAGAMPWTWYQQLEHLYVQRVHALAVHHNFSKFEALCCNAVQVVNAQYWECRTLAEGMDGWTSNGSSNTNEAPREHSFACSWSHAVPRGAGTCCTATD